MSETALPRTAAGVVAPGTTGTATRDAAPSPTREGPSSAAPGRRTASGSRVAGPASPRLRRLWRGDPGDSAWARPALLGLLLVTTGAYLWNLTANGYANSFYSAAAQAGSESWKAFFFGSSDAANSITVDKPPASLWAMALSVRLLGLSSFSILLPEVLMGVASVGVLHATVKRQFGAAAGLLAGGVLALTPVAVLMFRFNNPEALLVLLMTLAAWATMRSVEASSPRWFALVGVLVGLGFLTKTLQVFLVVPGFALAYLVAASAPLLTRVRHTLLGGLAAVLSAGWWVAVVELLPASMRPYVGGSQNNSFLELTFGYNGIGRLSGEETGSVGGAPGGGAWGTPSITRLLDAENGGQISWLLPAALLLLVVGLVLRGRAPRTDLRRAAYLAWGSWLVVTALVFSLMAGIYHAYYTVALAPAIAALVAMGAREAWERRETTLGALGLAAATTVTSVWAYWLLSRVTDWSPVLRIAVLVLGVAAAFGFLVVGRLHRRARVALVATALVAGLLGPAAYSAQTIGTPHSGSIVTAGPATAGGRGGMPGGAPPDGAAGPLGQAPGQAPGGTTPGTPGAAPGAPGTAPGGRDGATRDGTARGGMGGLLDSATPNTEVVTALTADSERYTWVAAAVGSQSAAGLQLGTQLPVMAIGGFNGSDPSPTLEQFQQYVADGRIHYFAAGGGFVGNSNGGSRSATTIATWVAENFTRVTIAGSTFYDLTQPLSATSTAAQA